MKILPLIAAALFATASFSSLAATEINAAQAQSNNYQSLGVVDVAQGNTEDMSLKAAVNAKAAQEGATHYRVIGVSTPGDSSLARASVELYR
ncbi:DUF1471 domain-containing protein [Rouxiella badensis]|jgi:hypothetical protein|uniref:YdgH/BhsA/McbA-like domain-containing protein n=1 Tax=Rouxiella badensis TaxID=1646377 RepID=A0A1X0WJH1_9GAMM|nr:DUF1471 domain-containing protein [Rouxiella badensis]MCC3702114.1 DUF1471 domain-containing protein [Rouxiella badensis]MCC3717120.1 DUF1471 domain-containing protein [Rouxiella badensis]MCC3728216.1 DUF1471 domain-containing protein [Rouxiella badensis]MCC3732120.1 DUF1471 domain-containing protein [Rouxiella badensis]MCC3739960.1 DUF1471 domain-containing protein [Rouxiella badensis]